MPFYPALKAVLMATAIGISNDRHKMFCLLYFYLWAFYVLVMPDPKVAGMMWYWLCMIGEISIIGLTIIIMLEYSYAFSILVIGASVSNILANCISLACPGLIYDFYPFIIRLGELLQCFALIIWSAPVIARLHRLHDYLLEKDHTWMRRLLKQVLT